MFGDSNNKDLEGLFNHRTNLDGSIGEYFTKSTKVDSPYTDLGILYIDWEHGKDLDGTGNNPDNVLGYVDWKTAQMDDKGIFVQRVLDRHNKYVKMLETLLYKGLISTSSMPIQHRVVKGMDGQIKEWPLLRDSLTVSPMEWRMVAEGNNLQVVKSLATELEKDGLTNTSLYKSLNIGDLLLLEIDIEKGML